MRSKKNNEKGFTLIELLAVIVILAILVMLAIPAVTRYLTASRRGAFADNALRSIEVVRNDIVTRGFTPTAGGNHNCSMDATINKYVCIYPLESSGSGDSKIVGINELLEKQLLKSPFGGDYKTVTIGTPPTTDTLVKVKVTQVSGTEYKYEMCMIDDGGNGFQYEEEKDIKDSKVSIGAFTSAESCDKSA